MKKSVFKGVRDRCHCIMGLAHKKPGQGEKMCSRDIKMMLLCEQTPGTPVRPQPWKMQHDSGTFQGAAKETPKAPSLCSPCMSRMKPIRLECSGSQFRRSRRSPQERDPRKKFINRAACHILQSNTNVMDRTPPVMVAVCHTSLGVKAQGHIGVNFPH